jgi:hypothetical protein
MLWVVLKPIHAFHTVVSRVITMVVAFMASITAASRGRSFGPQKV